MKKILFLTAAALFLGNSNSYANESIETESFKERVDEAEDSIDSKFEGIEKRIDEKMAQAKASGKSTKNLEKKKSKISKRKQQVKNTKAVSNRITHRKTKT